MTFNTKTRYGIRTMLEIAINGGEVGILQKDISVNQQLSLKYLDQIIHALKVAGLVSTVRGKKSGYILTRKPTEITMLDIHRAFEPEVCNVDCVSVAYHCEREDACLVKGFWQHVNLTITDYLRSITLDDLINKRVTRIEL